MGEIGRMFREFCAQKHTSCAEYARQIQTLMNIAINESTNFTLYELHFGEKVNNIITKTVQFPEQSEIPYDLAIIKVKKIK